MTFEPVRLPSPPPPPLLRLDLVGQRARLLVEQRQLPQCLALDDGIVQLQGQREREQRSSLTQYCNDFNDVGLISYLHPNPLKPSYLTVNPTRRQRRPQVRALLNLTKPSGTLL